MKPENMILYNKALLDIELWVGFEMCSMKEWDTNYHLLGEEIPMMSPG